MAQQTVSFPFDNNFDDIQGEVSAEITNVGGVSFTTGLVNSAADFSGSNQRLDSTNSFFHNLTGFSFEMVAWIRLDSLGVNHGLFGQTTNTYHCHVIGTNKVRWRVTTSGGNVILDSTETLSQDTWHRIRVGYDHGNTEIFLQIDDGTVQSSSTEGNAISTSTQNFSWGSIGSGFYMDGRQQLFMMRTDGLFSSTELDDHYNIAAQDAHTLAPVDLSVSPAIASAAVTQNHFLSPADSTVTIELDTPTLNQIHFLAPNGGSVALTLDTTAITQEGDDHALAPDDALVTSTIDAATITQVHILSPIDGSVSATLDTTTLSQIHIIAPDGCVVVALLHTTLTILPSEVSTASISLGSSYTATISLGTL